MNDLQVIGNGIRMPKLPGDVGYDLVLSEDCLVTPYGVRFGMIGARVRLPLGFWGLVTARSSAAVKYGVGVVPSVIDNGYTGVLRIGVFSMDTCAHPLSKGISIAQLILMPACVRPIQVVESFSETERGDKGWGSTGP